MVKCPICNLERKIEIPTNIVNKTSHLSAVLIPKNIVCEHTFHAFVDKNLTVRGYQKTDFELPIGFEEQRIDENLILESDLVYFETLKWNISPNNLKYLIRGIIFKKNTVFVIPDSKEDLVEILEKVFNFMFKDTFKHDITIIKKSIYKKMKKDFKNNTIIGWKKILNDKENIMNENEMEVEEKIVQSFYRKASKYEYITDLEHEIRKIFKISKLIVEIIQNLEKKDDIDVITIKEQLEKNYYIELDIQYLRYLLKVVRYYFKTYTPIHDSNEIPFFLDLLSK
jgi:hypothetical protein